MDRTLCPDEPESEFDGLLFTLDFAVAELASFAGTEAVLVFPVAETGTPDWVERLVGALELFIGGAGGGGFEVFMGRRPRQFGPWIASEK